MPAASFTREKLPRGDDLRLHDLRSPSRIYQVGVGVASFEVDLFGRVRSLTHAALEQYLAQEESRRSAQLSLIAADRQCLPDAGVGS